MGMTIGSPTGNMNAKAGVEAKIFPYTGKNGQSFIYTENLNATTSEENVAPTFFTHVRQSSQDRNSAKRKSSSSGCFFISAIRKTTM